MNIKPKNPVVSSIKIEAPVKKVYSAVIEVNKWPNWRSGVKSVSIKGNPSEGKSFIWKSGIKIKSKFHTIKENKEIGWTGNILWISAVHNWHFKSEGKSTVVTIKESLGGFLSSILEKGLKKMLEKDLKELKEYCEK